MDNELLVLHVSDTHLGLRQYGLEERERDIYESFMEVIDIVIKERVDLVIHSGDFFDSYRPPPQALLVAINGLRKLRDKGVPVVAVLGEHDTPKRRSFPPLLLLQELGLLRALGYNPAKRENYYLNTRSRKGVRVLVAGVSNHRSIEIRLLPERIRLVPKPPRDTPSIFMCHQGLREVVPMGEIGLEDLPEGFNYYGLGHIHSYTELSKNGVPVVYPGSIEATRMDEVGEGVRKYVVIASIDTRGSVVVDRHVLTSPRPQFFIDAEYKRLRDEIGRVLSRNRFIKKPVLHISIRNAPLSLRRQSLYALLDSLLRNRVLHYRVVALTTEEQEGVEKVAPPSESLNLLEILESLLKDKDRAALAMKLIEVLGYSSSMSDINESLRLVKEYARKKYGVEL